ncbi:MAG: hypothetical protein KatS3mg077_2820 [Candidatus Binatia bacterium]|nr:MAG: hypothetical protein KatS3mg077_2820 [Candidatus Binatia bacterium]
MIRTIRPETGRAARDTQIPRWLFLVGTMAMTLLFIGLGAAAWGGWAAYVAHPARAGAAVVLVVLTALASFSGINLSRGKREDTRARRLFLPFALGTVILAWLPPYMDRRELWVIDGDTARYLGLTLLVLGGALRVWPMFVLGRRFSGLVAIQEGHELVTTGPYRYVRHPSYLGALVGSAGWVLVFRSSVGLLLLVAGVWLAHARIEVEEALLESEFGSAYTEYCRRTWRLIPWVY